MKKKNLYAKKDPILHQICDTLPNVRVKKISLHDVVHV